MDSMAPIARADTARTEASDTSPPVTGSDGRGLGVIVSAGAGGVSGFSGSHGFSDSHGGSTRTRSQASSYRLDAGETRSSPSNRQTNTYHPCRSAVRCMGAPCASNAPAPILNVPFIAGISQVASNRGCRLPWGPLPRMACTPHRWRGCRDRRTTIRSPSHTADPPRNHRFHHP